MPTFNWVFENQPMVSGILTQLSSRKQFGSRRKRSLKREGGSYLYIHLYYRSVDLIIEMLRLYCCTLLCDESLIKISDEEDYLIIKNCRQTS